MVLIGRGYLTILMFLHFLWVPLFYGRIVGVVLDSPTYNRCFNGFIWLVSHIPFEDPEEGYFERFGKKGNMNLSEANNKALYG